MLPTPQQGRVDQRLSEILIAYKNPAYFAGEFFPVVPGLKDDTGLIPTFGKAHLRHYTTSKRAVYDESDHRINFEMGTDLKYSIDYYDLETYVPDRIKKQFRSPFDALAGAQLTVAEALFLEREVAAAAALTSTSILSQNVTLSGTDQWTNPTASDPLGDIDAAVAAVRAALGVDPNVISIHHDVLVALRRHDAFKALATAGIQGGQQFRDRLSVNSTIEALKAYYGFEKVIVPTNRRVTSKPGQTDTVGQVWNKDVIVFYVPPAPGLFQQSLGYSFQVEGGNMQTVVRRAPKDKGDLVEAQWAYQDAILMPEAAYLIKNAG